MEDVAIKVGHALEQSGVEYVLGGSVATSLQGEPRSTNDIDFAIRLSEDQVPALLSHLGAEFSVDEVALLDAIRRQGSANIFYLPSMTKIDLFIRGGSAFDKSEFMRRERMNLGPAASIFVASREDNTLRKLKWFRLGNEVSDRQWRDILGLLRIGKERVDWAYLEKWAPVLGVADLLTRAKAEAQLD